MGVGLALLALLASLAFSLVFGYSQARAATCGGYSFPCNDIISDASMSATGTMTEAQIQSFLVQEGSYLAGYTVQQHTGVGWSDSIDPYGWSAAHMIWEAANWYGLNPEVILTTLQKEQSLIQDPSPASWALDYAMGYGCPDTTGCSVTYLGFGKQVDMGAWQLAQNMSHANAGDTSFVGPYYTGNTISIDCDSSNNCTAVHLDDGATASLYRYTPHIHGNYSFYSLWWNRYNFGFAPPPPPPPAPSPQISGQSPAGGSTTGNNRPVIYAGFTDPGATINSGATVITLDGANVTASSTLMSGYASYRPPAALAPGSHSVSMTIIDSAGVSKSASWAFTVSQNSTTPKDYYWAWYDDIGSHDWVMLANPAGSPGALGFDASIAGIPVDGNSQVTSGQTLSETHAGIRGGPVDAMSLSGTDAVTSQRVLWGNSLEEIPGTASGQLSSQYYWPWYDQRTPGMSDWVMVSNQNSFPIYYEITVAGQLKKGTVGPGGSATPSFAGIMGGPVELSAWTDSGKGTAANVVASQRVLSGGGSAFNELPGIPASSLSDHYFWNWYDQQSAGALEWVMVANPNPTPVYYQVKLGGRQVSSGTLAPGQYVTPSFPGQLGGPVEVQAWNDSTKLATASVVATERSIWGPSFEETPGYAAGSLSSSYNWTWYDNSSAGASDWVMIANPNNYSVYYEVTVAGKLKGSGVIGAGANATPGFPGLSGGPVAVQAWTDSSKQTPASVMATQRVLWNGYLNEVVGTAFPLITAATPTGETGNSRPTISASLSSPYGSINASSIVVKLDGNNVTAGASKTAGYVSYRPDSSLSAGSHGVSISVSDSAGHSQTSSWTLNVPPGSYTPQDYFWSWYDDVGGHDWVMTANPSSASSSASLETAVSGRLMSLTGFSLSGSGCPSSQYCAPGQLPPGRVMPAEFPGTMAGPVRTSSLSGAEVLASQRYLWGQSSLEEIPGTAGGNLSDHYYWPWYDENSVGTTDWVMMSNPSTAPVYYEVSIAGKLKSSGTIGPGQSADPGFSGMSAGPLEVESWTSSDKSAPARLIASQRVLSGNGSALNELPGIPAAKLSDHYFWTRYDEQSSSNGDWVMIANPNQTPVYYELRIAGQLKASGPIAAGGSATSSFPGLAGGPVELQSWTDSGKSAPASVVATQRVIWGPSFEETPGYAAAGLSSAYGWTWYDNASPGYSNWVMISNVNPSPVYYEVSVGGSVKASGTILAGSYAAPQIAGTMGGPVEVHAWTDSSKQVKASILASQRVLLNGYFNEETGIPIS